MIKKRSYKVGGLDDRYKIIAREDGKELNTTHRFVLNYGYDPHARVALKAYAESVKEENPLLAYDLLTRLSETEPEGGES